MCSSDLFLNMDIGVNAKGKGEYCVLTCAPLTQHNKMGEASDASRPGGDFSENFLTSRAVFKQDLSVYGCSERVQGCLPGGVDFQALHTGLQLLLYLFRQRVLRLEERHLIDREKRLHKVAKLLQHRAAAQGRDA